MATIKQDRKDLEMLLNGISPIEAMSPSSPQASTLQTTPAIQPPTQAAKPQSVVDGTDLGVEKMFDFDYESVKKGLRKKARKTVLNIARHILTDDLVEEEYVQDKTEQDIETLTDLYMQLETNNLMQKALVTTVSRGNMMPRYFEVFGQLTEKISSINKQILTTEQTIRKTYLDLKFEIRDKQEEQLSNSETPALTTTQKEQDGLLVTNSLDLIERAKRRHREALENAKETTYTEE